MDPSDKNIYSPYLKLIDYALGRLEQDGREIVLLDAGCGHSTLLAEQYTRCKEVIGVDLDRIGLNKNKLVTRKIFADLSDIPIPDNSVDIVTSAWVFEHISNPVAFGEEVYRILKPGGYLIFITPNKDGWYAVFAENLPLAIHKKIAKRFYGRDFNDTFPTMYLLNKEEDIDDYLSVPRNFLKIEFIYNDDPKYMGFNIFMRPLAKLWHKIVMTKPMRKERVHVIGMYRRV